MISSEISYILTLNFSEEENAKTYLYFKSERDLCEKILVLSEFYTRIGSKDSGEGIDIVKEFFDNLQEFSLFRLEKENIYINESREYLINLVNKYLS